MWERGEGEKENLVGEAKGDEKSYYVGEGGEVLESIVGEGEGGARKHRWQGGGRREKNMGEGEGNARKYCGRGGDDEKENLVGEGKGGARKHCVGEGKGDARKHYVGEGKGGEAGKKTLWASGKEE